MKVETYKLKVSQDHKTATVKKWFGLYAWFWFHTEIWLEPLERRPYTYIFRDEIHNHKIRSTTIIIIVTSILVWSTLKVPTLVILDLLYGFLWGHLVWGTKYIPLEQEDPQIEDC